MLKLTKAQARIKFLEGEVIYIMPCKKHWAVTPMCKSDKSIREDIVFRMQMYNMTAKEAMIASFNNYINHFEYYNCNNEVGKYTHFYY